MNFKYLLVGDFSWNAAALLSRTRENPLAPQWNTPMWFPISLGMNPKLRRVQGRLGKMFSRYGMKTVFLEETAAFSSFALQAADGHSRPQSFHAFLEILTLWVFLPLF